MKTKLTKKGLDSQLCNPEDASLEIVAEKISLAGKDLSNTIKQFEKEISALKEEMKKQCTFSEFEKEIQILRKEMEKFTKKEKVQKD